MVFLLEISVYELAKASRKRGFRLVMGAVLQ